MQRLHYEIKGMSCAACVMHVERAVKSALGDIQASTSVSLLTNSLSVIPSRELSVSELEAIQKRLSAAISSAGYQLLEYEKNENHQNKEQRNRLIRLIVSAIFTGLLMYVAMGEMIGLSIPNLLRGSEHMLHMAILQFVLTLPVVVLNFKFFKTNYF